MEPRRISVSTNYLLCNIFRAEKPLAGSLARVVAMPLLTFRRPGCRRAQSEHERGPSVNTWRDVRSDVGLTTCEPWVAPDCSLRRALAAITAPGLIQTESPVAPQPLADCLCADQTSGRTDSGEPSTGSAAGQHGGRTRAVGVPTLRYTSRMPSIGDPGADPPQLDEWLRAAEQRYLAELTFPEVTRALRALSSCYVERRGKLADGSALDGAGKRAAFALFYAPLHALITHRVARALPAPLAPGTRLLDLGCGTGAASAAWALAAASSIEIEGFDRSAWAVSEAPWTWRACGVRGRATRTDVARLRLPRGPHACLAAFTINELPAETRHAVRGRLLAAAHDGHPVLIIEPLAGAVAPWWTEWVDAFQQAGARAAEWRFPAQLPDIVARFDRAAGLRHHELTARTIYVEQRTA